MISPPHMRDGERLAEPLLSLRWRFSITREAREREGGDQDREIKRDHGRERRKYRERERRKYRERERKGETFTSPLDGTFSVTREGEMRRKREKRKRRRRKRRGTAIPPRDGNFCRKRERIWHAATGNSVERERERDRGKEREKKREINPSRDGREIRRETIVSPCD